ncbi:MAG TPA: DUF5908 family protein [Phnomibacter sp.]|nr:DUF5908 family protein [Phnomibacter sp.]
MPVIVNELIIRATVGNDNPGGSTGGQTAATAQATTGKALAEQEKLVAICVAQVLEILEKKKER